MSDEKPKDSKFYKIRNSQLCELFEKLKVNITLHNEYIRPTFVLDGKWKLPIRTFDTNFVFFNQKFNKDEESMKKVINLKKDKELTQDTLDDIASFIVMEMEKRPFFLIKRNDLFLCKYGKKKFNDNDNIALFGLSDAMIFHENNYAQDLKKHLESIGYTDITVIDSATLS